MGKRRSEIDVSISMGGDGEDDFPCEDLSPSRGMDQCSLGSLSNTVDRAAEKDGSWLRFVCKTSRNCGDSSECQKRS